MRRLVNNWLFGEVSPLLSGRLDSDVYGNSCSELLNMKVHRQGGISRRPPLKFKTLANGSVRMIPFIVDDTNRFIVLFGASSLKVYDYINGTTSTVGLPTHEETEHSWNSITASKCRDIKYAQYYNDLYFVHPDYPLMRLRFDGVNFIASTPQVLVNQDIKARKIKLTISSLASMTESISFTFDTNHISFSVSTSTTVADVISEIKNHSYDGWTVESDSNYVTFKPDKTIDLYRSYDFTDTDYFNCINGSGVAPLSFSFAWGYDENVDTDEIGVVYGSDDFNDCYLNRKNESGRYEFASDIAIICERMFLSVNGNPCNIYASRPYGTSQLVYPKRSNDTILDFVQYEIVTTEKTEMKEETDLPVVIAKDTNNEIIYEGTTTMQKLWETPNEGVITTKKSLDEYRKGKYVNGVYEPNSAKEYVVVHDTQNVARVKKLQKRTTTYSTLVDYIESRNMFFETEDSELDTSKLVADDYEYVAKLTDYGWYSYMIVKYNSDGISYASQHPDLEYLHTVIDRNDVYGFRLSTDEDNLGYGGIIRQFVKTQDYSRAPNKIYYTYSQGEYTPLSETAPFNRDTAYEAKLKFNENLTIYEYGPQYVLVSSGEMLTTKYMDNGMIESMSYEGVPIVKAVPYYQFDISSDSNIYAESIEIEKVATASTAIEFQLASGRNDRISWMRLGDYIMVGTECAEWRLETSINALKTEASMYSSFGSNNGLSTNLGTDVIFLQRGNGLRLFYKDYYGLQNVELTLTNPDIMKGDIKELVSASTPEPAVYALNGDDIVALCIDRTNGVQAFSKWTFKVDKPKSLCVMENGSTQVLVALMSNGVSTYIAEFDNEEDYDFSDCAYGYRLTSDTAVAQGKTYYSKNGDVYTVAIPVSNPKEEGLYELGWFDNLRNYVSKMTANPFDAVMQDGSVTIGEAKNVSKMIFRCLNTGHIKTYFNDKDKTTTRTPVCCDQNNQYLAGLADHSVNVNGGTTRDLMITVESVDSEPITLLAMAYDLRLNKNG